MGQHLGKGDACIGHLDQHLSFGLERTVNENGRGGALLGAQEVRVVLRESEITGMGPIGGSKAGQNERRIACHLAANERGNLGNRETHVVIIKLASYYSIERCV